MRNTEVQISLSTILDLLKGERLTTVLRVGKGVEVTIYNPEAWEIQEEEDLETIVKWGELVKKLSKLLKED